MKAYFSICLALALIAAPLPVSGQHDAPGQDQERITAIVLRGSPPLQFYDRDTGEATGFIVDAMNKIAERAGLQVSYVFDDSWSGMIEKLISGKADVIASLAISEERQKDLLFTDIIHSAPISIFVRSQNYTIDSLVPGIRAGTTKGGIPLEYMKKIPEMDIKLYNTFSEGLFSLLAGEIDAFVAADAIFLKLAQDAGIDDKIKIAGKPLADIKRSIALRKDSTVLLSRLNQAIHGFVSSPDYQKLYIKWYGKPRPFWTTRSIFYSMLGLFLFTLSGMAFWRYRSVMNLNRSLMENIREREKAEKTLRLSEEKFFKAFRSSPVLFSISTLDDGTFIELNDAFLKATGYTRKELIGRAVITFGLWHDPADRDRIMDLLRKDGVVTNAEITIRIKSGEVIPVLWSAELINIEGIPCVLAVALDISERKKLERQLLQAQKMEAVGQLAGGVAHDFNNILTAIVSYAHLLEMRFREDVQSRDNLRNILSLSDRATKITQGLLAFSRRQYFDFAPLKLNEIIRNTREILFSFIGKDIDIKLNLTDSNPVIQGDRTQIEQALMNLATNARDAMPGGGSLEIETEILVMDNAFIKAHGFGTPGDYVILSVTDTGSGMAGETRQRIFEPFFTTKDVGKGTGLGMSVVYGIVNQHEGHIEVYSEPGKGTEFKIYIPLIEAAPELKQQEKHTIVPGKEETVLLAEDEEAVRDSIKKVLEEYKYTVIEANDGHDALQKFRKYGDTIKLLILDVVMPGMNGKETLEEAKKISPGIKAIFMSGYTGKIILNKEALFPNVPFVSKPIVPDEFLRRIRQVLDS